MKPATLLLGASTLVLAALSIYLGRELGAARAEADEAARRASQLGARVAELQRSPGERAVFGSIAPAPAAAAQRGVVEMALPTEAGVATPADNAQAMRDAFAQRMEQPAVRRAFVAQLRVGAKQMYADFVAEHDL